MRVFVTGASGWIGSAVVPELIGAGHQVVGLARSDASAAALTAAGAEVRRGTLDDLEVLRDAAATSDGVIHLAFKHDLAFSGGFLSAAEADRRAVEAFGEALAGSDRPFVLAAGLLGLAPGRVATEQDGRVADRPTAADPGAPSAADPGGPSADPGGPSANPDGPSANPDGPSVQPSGPEARRATAHLALALADRGVRSSVLRLPPTVYGDGDHGFMATIVGIAREKGVSGYVGDGSNRWPAVHRSDAAHLFRLALEQAPAGSVLHAVGDEGVPIRAIAEVIGRHLDLPVAAVPAEHFTWLGHFLGIDGPASSTLTRELLDWHPTQPGLLDDLDKGHYFRTP